MACIQTDSLSGHGSILCPPPASAASSSGNKRRRKRASRPDQSRRRLYIAVEGRESLYSQLFPPPPPPPPPLGVSLAAGGGGGGGVLSHLFMAACQHILLVERDGKEDSRIGNVTRASSFPPRVCFNLSTGRSKGGWGGMRVYAVGLCIFGLDLNASMRRRRRGGGADDFLGQVAGRGGSGRRFCAALDGGRRNTVSTLATKQKNPRKYVRNRHLFPYNISPEHTRPITCLQPPLPW